MISLNTVSFSWFDIISKQGSDSGLRFRMKCIKEGLGGYKPYWYLRMKETWRTWRPDQVGRL